VTVAVYRSSSSPGVLLLLLPGKLAQSKLTSKNSVALRFGFSTIGFLILLARSVTAGAGHVPSDSAVTCTRLAAAAASGMVTAVAPRFWICTVTVFATLRFFA
jgi:hypothetical protein